MESKIGGQWNGQQEGLKPLIGSKLKFSCHRGISCFTECCADLRLILTPYDILRMKKRLNLPAEEFLKEYTQPEEESESLFPMIRLKMSDDSKRRCPLVSPQGCTIYEDRPGACRLYPLGRAAATGSPGRGDREFYFLVDESHCLGFREGREWTVEEWLKDQGAGHYNEMNRPWMEIVTSQSPRIQDLTGEKLGMFYLTSYNLDRFREFVFQTKFLKVLDITSGVIGKIAADDEELLKLGMKWLKFALFGEDTLSPTCF
jgi:Fe-S-cluster containining protein